MTSLLRFLLLGVMVVSLGSIAYRFIPADQLDTPRQFVKPAASDLPEGKAVPVDLFAGETLKNQITQYGIHPRVLKDQHLDWLAYVAASAIAPDAKGVSEALFALPVSRNGYLRNVGYYEFGATRTRALGDGVFLALVPGGVSADQRKDDLANVADQQKKNYGGPFHRLVVVEYTLDSDTGTATLTRRPDVGYKVLFSPEYGYVEGDVTSLADIKNFFAKADDLTRVVRSGEKLTMGGRKILARNYRGIGAEHVAAIWQADQKLQQEEQRLKEAVDAKNRELSAKLHRHEISQQEGQAIYEDYAKKLYFKAHEDGLVPHSGFSLDPDFDMPGLRADTPDLLKDLKSLGTISEEESASIINGLKSDDIRPMLRLIADLKKSEDDDDQLTGNVLQSLEEKHSYQAARYDGDLKGSETGMILFYTDLLAKIWAIHFEYSSPEEAVPGFIDLVTNPIPAIYKQERKELPSARLWFGPNDAEFQIASGRSELLFSRRATRIFSAGSDGIEEEKEVQTSANMAAPIDWWNDHYEEVAAYEQEYERLNEIIKWSIVIGWLNGSEQADLLAALRDVKVRRDHRLPDWVRHQPNLRFTNWDAVEFLPEGYLGTKTEAMPILYSPLSNRGHVYYGGVSLAEKQAISSRPLVGNLEGSLRGPGIDYASTTSERIVTFDKTIFTRKAVNDLHAAVDIAPREGLKLRGSVTQVAHSKVEMNVNLAGHKSVFGAKLGEVPIGELRVERTGNGFKVGWQARDLDLANSLAGDMSLSPEIFFNPLVDPKVKASIDIGDKGILVRLHGSEDWMVISPETSPRADIAKGWLARSAHPEGMVGFQVRPVNDLSAELGSDSVLAINESGSFAKIQSGIKLSDGGAITFSDGSSLKLSRTPNGEPVISTAEAEAKGIDLAELAEALANPNGLPRLNVRTSEKIALNLPISAKSRRVALALERNNPEQLAKAIAEAPEEALRVLDNEVKVQARVADRLAESDRIEDALTFLDEGISRLGAEPDLVLRRNLLLLAKEKPWLAATDGRLPPLRNRDTLFNAITKRFQDTKNPVEAHNIKQLSAYAHTNEGMTRDLGELGHPVLEMEDGALQHTFVLVRRPPDEIRSASELKPNARVYVADDPALSGLDWPGDIQSVMTSLMGRDSVAVLHLPTGGIDQFAPAMVKITAGNQQRILHYRGNIPNSSSSQSQNSCNDDDSLDQCGNDEVYLVMGKGA